MSIKLEDQIKQLVVDRLFLNIDPDSIGDEDDLMKIFDLDSIRRFEISIGIEMEFDLDLSEVDFDIENFTTIKRLAELVKKLAD